MNGLKCHVFAELRKAEPDAKGRTQRGGHDASSGPVEYLRGSHSCVRNETLMSEKSPQKKGAMKQGKTLKEKRADKSAKRDNKKGLMDK